MIYLSKGGAGADSDHMWIRPWVNDLWFKFLEKRVSVSTYFHVFSNLILQWLQKYVIAKAGETRGSRTALLNSLSTPLSEINDDLISGKFI